MSKKLITLCVLFVHFWGPALAEAHPIKKTFQYSVVEVLMDRLKDDSAELNRPIPQQKIPFKQRTDPYISIGTAWFVNSKELFSAAHVFQASMTPFTRNFYVRTIFGEVFPVNAVTLYSNRYDIVSFTLKSYPQKILPIAIARSFNIGDDVCVPGNALGQGIGLRCGGQISSLAPEPRNGEWKEIYFSTPVSSGNSGGPLVDSNGRALGIVVRKIPGEDLNIAVPFSELTQLNGRLEYFEKDLGFQNGAVQSLQAKSDLKIGSTQPMTMMEWVRLLAAGTNNHLLRMASSYESSWLKNGVLSSRPARTYLRNPRKGSYFTRVKFVNHDLSQVDGDEGGLEKYRRTKRKVILQKMSEKSIYFISKNRGEKIETILNNPREIMDTILSTGRLLTRKFVDEELYYKSLGQPMVTSLVQDLLGRNWLMYSWKMNEIQTAVGLFCTPRPTDVACSFHSYDAMLAPETVAAMFRVEIAELSLSYFGSSAEWSDFLSQLNRFRPTFMSGVSVSRSEGRIRITAQELTIVAEDAANGNDSLVINFCPDLINPLKQTAYAVSYFPNLSEKIMISTMRFHKLGKSPGDLNAWVAKSSGIYRRKTGRFVAAKFVDQKNSDLALIGYMYGDEEKKLSRFLNSTEFGMTSSSEKSADLSKFM